jgi:hypothetical protein
MRLTYLMGCDIHPDRMLDLQSNSDLTVLNQGGQGWVPIKSPVQGLARGQMSIREPKS